MSCDTMRIQISSRSSRGRSKIVSLLWAMARFFEGQVSISKTHELNEMDLTTGMSGSFCALCTTLYQMISKVRICPNSLTVTHS